MRAPHLALGLAVVAAVLVPAATARAAASQRGLALTVSAPSVADVAHARVSITLTNTSKRPITLLSHVATHELHYDWLHLRLAVKVPSADKPRLPGANPCAAGEVDWLWQEVSLSDSRDRSARVQRTLRPGESLTHVIDLSDWPARSINHSAPLRPGAYQLEASYTVAKERGVWTGSLVSPRASFTIAGKTPVGVCPIK